MTMWLPARMIMAIAALVVAPAMAETVDPAAIAELAENCQICHGPMGQGAGALQAIGGRSVYDLILLLTGFRDGTLSATLMQRLMKPLSDAEIAALAAEIAQWK